MGKIRASRNDRRPAVVESLEGRTLMSVTDPTTPTLLIHMNGNGVYHGSLFDGTPFVMHLRNGAADVYQIDNRLQLLVGATNKGCTLTLDGKFILANVIVSGLLKNFKAPEATLAGVLSVNGSAGTVLLNSITGSLLTTGSLGKLVTGSVTGTVAAGGAVGAITVGSLDNATVLSGANLGANEQVGGGDDVYTVGYIGNMRVTGPITSSFVGVGVAPGVDGVFGTPDDVTAGAGELKSLYLAFGSDPNSHFTAGSFVHISMPYRVKLPIFDPRFRAI
ncbi:MAG TPA: hypothetical protein VFC78_16740 [Tepidisphaeraceae bacterium]|nr:hypothetical protein [Tepidisphaeraceae bacterium]